MLCYGLILSFKNIVYIYKCKHTKGMQKCINTGLSWFYSGSSLLMNIKVYFFYHFFFYKMMRLSYTPFTLFFFYSRKWYCQVKGHATETLGSVQSFSCVRLFVTLWTAARQASLSITNSRTLLKLMSNELVMLSNHLILCRPLLLPQTLGTSWQSALQNVFQFKFPTKMQEDFHSDSLQQWDFSNTERLRYCWKSQVDKM